MSFRIPHAQLPSLNHFCCKTLHHVFKCWSKRRPSLYSTTVDDAILILDEGSWGSREGQTSFLVCCRWAICYLSNNRGRAYAHRAWLWHLQLHNEPPWFGTEVKSLPQAILCLLCLPAINTGQIMLKLFLYLLLCVFSNLNARFFLGPDYNKQFGLFHQW